MATFFLLKCNFNLTFVFIHFISYFQRTRNLIRTTTMYKFQTLCYIGVLMQLRLMFDSKIFCWYVK